MSSDLTSELLQIDAELQQLQKQVDELQQRQSVLRRKKRQLEKCLVVVAEEDNMISWDKTNYPWSKKVDELKQSVFQIPQFRPLQLSTINVTLSSKDCILIMPTGGGKSLCFQLPALVSEGVTLVVSPLVSLMEDQMMALADLNIPARMMSASCTKEQNNQIHQAMIDKRSDLKLLYVTPEKLAKSKMFMNKLEKMYELGRFSRLVIDEVHCCSAWGHDFRPDFKMLGIMKRQFPKIPILGLTATATSHVVEDVKKILNIQACIVLKATFNRPNLFYEVRLKPTSQQDVIEDLTSVISSRFAGQSGIIYCFSTKDTEEVANELRKRKILAHHYHAYVDPQLRSKVHRKWTTGEIQVIVATIAFGMGINKCNVRFVIHHSLSKSLENYYQESGRAGRDSKPAYCLLYYRSADIFRQSTMVFTEQTGLENLYKIVAYCHDLTRCRRTLVAQHFGELWSSDQCKEMCDHCKQEGVVGIRDITIHCLNLLNIMETSTRKDVRLTVKKLTDAFTKDKGGKLRAEMQERIIIHLLLESYFREDFHFTPYSTISYLVPGPKAAFVKNGKDKILLPIVEKKSVKSRPSIAASITSENETSSRNLPNSLISSPSTKSKKKETNENIIAAKKIKKKIKHVIISDEDSNTDDETDFKSSEESATSFIKAINVEVNDSTDCQLVLDISKETITLPLKNEFDKPKEYINVKYSKTENSDSASKHDGKQRKSNHHKIAENKEMFKSEPRKRKQSQEEVNFKKTKLNVIDVEDE